MKLAKRILPLLFCLLLLVPQTAFSASAAPLSAAKSVQAVTLYGQPITLYTYLLDNENYVRLHDLAWYCSAGSNAFSARWSGADMAVYLTTGGIYIAGGTENIPHTPGPVSAGLIEPDPYALYVDGEPVHLTATELRIVELLMKNPGRVFPAEEIYERVWGETAYAVENTVMVHIRRIREKIEINPKEPKYLKVVWGIGYKIEKL